LHPIGHIELKGKLPLFSSRVRRYRPSGPGEALGQDWNCPKLQALSRSKIGVVQGRLEEEYILQLGACLYPQIGYGVAIVGQLDRLCERMGILAQLLHLEIYYRYVDVEVDVGEIGYGLSVQVGQAKEYGVVR